MTPDKRAVALKILGYTWLTVHVRTDAHGLIVPKHLTRAKTLVLQVGYGMPVPIPDLAVTAYGIGGTLSFGGVPFWCSVPWAAVYAMMGNDGRGQIWPDDEPAKVVRIVSSNKSIRTTPARGVLKLIHKT